MNIWGFRTLKHSHRMQTKTHLPHLPVPMNFQVLRCHSPDTKKGSSIGAKEIPRHLKGKDSRPPICLLGCNEPTATPRLLPTPFPLLPAPFELISSCPTLSFSSPPASFPNDDDISTPSCPRRFAEPSGRGRGCSSTPFVSGRESGLGFRVWTASGRVCAAAAS